MKQKDIFDEMATKWQSTMVARHQVGAFSGGLLHPRTMANLDSRGKGPDDRFYIGRNAGYTVDALVRWMRARATRREAR